MNTHTLGRYMERLFPQVVLGMIIPLLQVAYVLSMTRLRLIVISILMFVILYPKVRDGLGSHMRAMHVKKHNPFCRKEGFLGCSEEKSQRHLYKSRPALKLHENDRLTCDECNYKFEL